jgi:hypothetical protein
MSRFAHESEKNPGDGSKHPLGKKFKRALFNLKASLSGSDGDLGVLRQFGRVKKR